MRVLRVNNTSLLNATPIRENNREAPPPGELIKIHYRIR